MALRAATIILVCCALLGSALGSDNATYVTGKILSVERRTSTPSGYTTTDQPLQSHAATYKFVISAGGTNYTCTIDADRTGDGNWLVGRDIQVRVKGKILYAKKANGEIERCYIVNKEPVK